LYPEEELAAAGGGDRRNWRGALFQSWKSTDLVHVISRKVLLAYALLVGLGAMLFLAWEVGETREAISTRHAELHRAAEKPMSEALWTFNETVLAALVLGLEQEAAITGARIRSSDGRLAFASGALTGSPPGWGTWLSDRYVSQWPVTWTSDRGSELIGYLEMETSEQVIRSRLLQRMLLILIFSTIALLSLFAVFLAVIRSQVVRPVSMLARIMDEYQLGEAGTVARGLPRPPGEIGKLYDSFRVLEDRLGAAHAQLTSAAEEMARQLARQAAELSEAHERNMSLGVSRAQEAERRRLMREMHDGFGSELVSARIAVERGNLSQVEIAAFLSKCIADLHLIINVTGTEAGNLAEAIADWRYRVSRQLAGGPFRLIWDVNLAGAPKITQRAALQILRIAQEALFNATRHSGASEIRIRAGHADGAINLAVADNGAGFSPDRLSGSGNRGKGLASMRARARDIGASLDFGFAGGCTVALVYRPDGAFRDGLAEERVSA
jgi:signal transduction histidine kinase